MPELPEVEVVRRGLSDTVDGRRLQVVVVREHRLRWPIAPDLPQRVAGRQLQRLERRGKYLLLGFDNGWLIIHLGMSGSLRFIPQHSGSHAGEPRLHDHVDLVFEHGLLRYHDPRRFGAMLWHPISAGPVEAHPLLQTLGIEPFDPAFDGRLLHQRTRSTRVAVKQVLLAGKIVVGVGNIYASESLFLAGIRPTVRADRISLPRYERLAEAIRGTLAAAIERGGSSLRDFVGSSGEPGYFQLDARVYGRAGEPCRSCGGLIRLLRQQQRATFWCPACQR